MNHWLLLALSLTVISLGGCGNVAETNVSSSSEQDSNELISETTDPAIEEVDDDAASVSIDTAYLISSDGIGVAQLGMSFGELKQALPDDVEYIIESPFIVDFDAIAVRQNDETRFYLLYLAGESFTDEDIIQGLMTTNSAYKTAEGIGVETSIYEAEEVYGEATLSYSLANESREYVRFENHPGGNLAFGVYGGGAEAADYSGIYANPAAEYNETQDYVEDATIQTILVVCVAEACT